MKFLPSIKFLLILSPILFLSQNTVSIETESLYKMPKPTVFENINNEGILNTSIPYTYTANKTRTTVNKTNLNNGFILVSEVHYKWADPNWENEIKFTYIYDGDKRIQKLRENWSGSNWVFDSKLIYSYDINNNMNLAVREQWNGLNWFEDSMRVYTYDSNNNLIEELRTKRVSGSWKNDIRYTYKYDGNNNRIEKLLQNWNPLSSNWDNEKLVEYSYIGNRMKNETWLIMGSLFWENYYRYDYYYDSNNNLDYTIHQLPMNDTTWDNYYKYDYLYDVDSNVIRTTSTPWTGGWGQSWVKVDYYYDGNNNQTEYIRHTWQFSNWVTSSRVTYAYEPITGIEPFEDEVYEYDLFNNYPNPFNPSTTIKYSIPKQSNVSIKVFDVLGSEVATLVNKEQPKGNYEVEFNGSELTSGIYFYRLQAGDYIETKKMILLK